MTQFNKYLPWIIIVILAGFHLFRSKPVPPTDGNKESVKEIKADRDSLTRVIELKSDTIGALRTRRAVLEFERDKAERERAILIKQNESKKFIGYSNHGSRDSVLTKLYSTFRPVRQPCF